MTQQELAIITCTEFGDQWGNGGRAYNETLVGTEWDLTEIKNKLEKVKLLIETQALTKKRVSELLKNLDALTWAIEPIGGE